MYQQNIVNSCGADQHMPRKKLLSEACRIITESLRTIPNDSMYRTASITLLLNNKQNSVTTIKNSRQISNSRHLLHSHILTLSRHKSRRELSTVVQKQQLNILALKHTVNWWKASERRAFYSNIVQKIIKEITDSTLLPRNDWYALNWARTRVSRTD